MKPNFIFMGTPDFGVPALTYLVGRGYTAKAVVTQPDRAKGRGRQFMMSAVKQCAMELDIPVLQPEKVNDKSFLEQLKAINAEVIIVAAYGQILKQPLLDLPRLGCINLHGSLLPLYRGAAPIQWAIANGDKQTGVTVQHMALKVDSGDILVKETAPIKEDDKAEDLFDRLAQLGGPALEKALVLLAKHGKTIGEPQNESEATFAPRLTREDGIIDWTKTAEEIHNLVRAFNPWPGTMTTAGGEQLKILSTKRTNEAVPDDTNPGTIIDADDRQGWLVVAGNQTAIRITDVQCANSKAMAAQSYTCGYQVGVGDMLGEKENAL